MRIIGLTGGSGTGKSTVGRRLLQLGAGCVDADAVYRDLTAGCAPMLAALQAEFGAVLTAEGTLDRPALARIVFADAANLRRLNAITYPYIRQASLDAIAAQSDLPVVLYDAPTLFENGADEFCDAVIGVLAPYEGRLRRIMARDKLTEDAARARLDAQPDDTFYRERCTYIVENSGDLVALFAQADSIYRQLLGQTETESGSTLPRTGKEGTHQ